MIQEERAKVVGASVKYVLWIDLGGVSARLILRPTGYAGSSGTCQDYPLLSSSGIKERNNESVWSVRGGFGTVVPIGQINRRKLNMFFLPHENR